MDKNIDSEKLFCPFEFKDFSKLKSIRLFNMCFKKEKISKIQCIDDLNRIKSQIHLVSRRHGYPSTGFGNGFKLFEEDGQIKLKKIEQYTSNKLNTKYGLVICKNHGEWGGNIFIQSNDNVWELNSHHYSFEYAFEYVGRIFVISTTSHMASYRCGIHEIRKSDNGFELQTLLETDLLDFGAYHKERNYLYFYSNAKYNGLFRLDLNNMLVEVINLNLCNRIPISSMIKKDKYIYIYGEFNIVKYDLYKRKIESIYTNLELNQISQYCYADIKLIDIWEDLLV